MASVIQNEINRIVAERDTQTSLINQIATALEGKAAGGGGASIETCNVSITNKRFDMPMMTYTALKDGVIQTVVLENIASGTTTNIECIKGTKVIVSEKNYAYQSGMMITEITGGITFEKSIIYTSGAANGIYTITGDGTLTLTNDS